MKPNSLMIPDTEFHKIFYSTGNVSHSLKTILFPYLNKTLNLDDMSRMLIESQSNDELVAYQCASIDDAIRLHKILITHKIPSLMLISDYGDHRILCGKSVLKKVRGTDVDIQYRNMPICIVPKADLAAPITVNALSSHEAILFKDFLSSAMPNMSKLYLRISEDTYADGSHQISIPSRLINKDQSEDFVMNIALSLVRACLCCSLPTASDIVDFYGSIIFSM